jgi:hypothetical protein
VLVRLSKHRKKKFSERPFIYGFRDNRTALRRRGRKGLCFSRFSGTYRYGATFTPILSHVRHVKRVFCPEKFLAHVITSNNDDTLTLVKLALDKDGIMAQFLLTEASIDGKECAV